MITRRFMPIFAALGLSLASATAMAQPQELPPQAGYRVIVAGGDVGEFKINVDRRIAHTESGYVFPLLIGNMPARKIIVHGSDNVSVDFTELGGGNGDCWISIFVYPAKNAIAEEANEIETAIMDNLQGGRVEADLGPLPANAADGAQKWFRGKYGTVENALTGYVLARRGKFWIKSRATIPPACRDGPARTRQALADFSWFLPVREEITANPE